MLPQLSSNAQPFPPSYGLGLNGLEWCGGGDPGPWRGLEPFGLSFLHKAVSFMLQFSLTQPPGQRGGDVRLDQPRAPKFT